MKYFLLLFFVCTLNAMNPIHERTHAEQLRSLATQLKGLASQEKQADAERLHKEFNKIMFVVEFDSSSLNKTEKEFNQTAYSQFLNI